MVFTQLLSAHTLLTRACLMGLKQGKVSSSSAIITNQLMTGLMKLVHFVLAESQCFQGRAEGNTESLGFSRNTMYLFPER